MVLKWSPSWTLWISSRAIWRS